MAEKQQPPEEMRAFFDQRSKSYDEHMQENVASFDSFYRAVAFPIPHTDQPLRILDLGCGTGLEIEGIFDRAPGAQITGIDLSPKMLSECREKYADRQGQLDLVCASYLDHPLGVKQYDYVLSVMTLHHLLPEKKLQIYKNVFNALVEGGVYIEGDYIVSEQKSQALLKAYHQNRFSAGETQDGRFHVDIPLSMGKTRVLLQQAGFSEIHELWSGEEAVVLQAKKI